MKGILTAFFLLASALAAPSPARGAEQAWLARIRGTINPASSSYLTGAIRAAENAKASLLLVELDTPGGLLSSVREMARAIDQSRVPVIVYVSPAGSSATSAGALLMLASHVAAMTPGTHIGAAHPVGPRGEEIQGAAGEKATHDTAAFARGLADLRGRSRELADAVVSKSQSFTAEEALRGNLIDIVAGTREELLQKLDGREIRLHGSALKLRSGSITDSELHRIEMSSGQKLLHFFADPNVAAILLSLGLFLLYVELSNPGITLAGVAGGISLLIALMAFQLLPIQAGGLVLIGLGVVLMIAEFFVVSGGALAAGGVVSFVLGLIWVVDPSSTSIRVSPSVWVPIGLGLGSGITILTVAAARTRQLSREALQRIGGGTLAGLAGYEGHVQAVQPGGRSGKALIRGEVWDFESETELAPGDAISVIETRGMHLLVRRFR